MSAHVWSFCGAALLLLSVIGCLIAKSPAEGLSGVVTFCLGVFCLAVGEVLQQLRAIRARLDQGAPKP